MRRRVLVTGVAGFLGSHLVDRLLGEGFKVVGIDNLMTGNLDNLTQALKDPHFHFQLGDVREPLPCCAELVFNLACPASPKHYQADPYTTFTTSTVGAQRLIEMVQSKPDCRIVHASTSEVYGDPQVHPQPESYQGNVNPLGPRACYDEGKRGAETLLNDSGLDVRIVRLFNTYGPRMAVDDGRVISNFIVQALREEPLIVFGGLQTRAFSYVDDIIDGLMGVAQLDSLDGALNLGDPWEMEIRLLATLIIELTGSGTGLIYRKPTQDDPKQRCPDIEKAKRLIGFSPKTQLRDGLRLTIDDLRERL